MTTETNAPETEAPEVDTTELTLSEPKAVEPVKTPTASVDADDTTVVEYEKTGDVGLDMALNFIGKAGLSSEHPAVKAAATGDFSILKATLAAKGVVGWEQFVALGEAAYTRTSAANEAKNEAIREAVYKEAGGKEEWAAIQKWASENATPEEKAEVNALLNQGGLAAKGAVRYLTETYNRAGNVEVNPRDANSNAGRQAGGSDANAALSPKAYSEAVQSLNNKLGGRLEGSREYEALQKRRMAFKG